MKLYGNLGKKRYTEMQETRSSYHGNREVAIWGKYFLETFPEYIQEPILDIGCGIGSLLNVFREEGKFAMGLDISRGASRRGIEDGFPILNHDAQKRLPLPDKSFKTVLMFHALEHTFHPDKVIKNIHRILVPGGKVCIILPLGDNFGRSGEGDTTSAHFSRLPTVESLEELFKDYEILISKVTDIDQGYLIIATPK